MGSLFFFPCEFPIEFNLLYGESERNTSNGSDVRNPCDCINLENWHFHNFIIAEEVFAKALQIL